MNQLSTVKQSQQQYSIWGFKSIYMGDLSGYKMVKEWRDLFLMRLWLPDVNFQTKVINKGTINLRTKYSRSNLF